MNQVKAINGTVCIVLEDGLGKGIRTGSMYKMKKVIQGNSICYFIKHLDDKTHHYYETSYKIYEEFKKTYFYHIKNSF